MILFIFDPRFGFFGFSFGKNSSMNSIENETNKIIIWIIITKNNEIRIYSLIEDVEEFLKWVFQQRNKGYYDVEDALEELLVLDNDTTSQENVRKKRMNNDEEVKEGCVLSKLLSRLSYLVHILKEKLFLYFLKN